MRPTLVVPVRSRTHFLDMYFEKGGLGGVFLRGAADLDLGDEVDLEISFLDTQMRFRVRGQVRWRRTTGASRTLPPGLGVEFSAGQKASERMLIDYALGREVRLVHRHDRRYGAQLPVKVRQGGQTLHELTDDISEGGAFLVTDEPFAVGDALVLSIRPPGAIFGVRVPAHVAWRREEGPRGVGVEFDFDSPRKRAQIERLIAQLRMDMIRELHVRVPRRTAPGENP